MPNADTAINKKSVERKKHPQVVNVCKKSVGIITIIKQIWEVEISLIVGKLIASTSTIEK